MQSRFKLISKLTVFSGLLAGMFAVSVSPGLAQGSNFLPGGGIQMGANGPVASFGPGGVVTGANGPSFGAPSGPAMGFNTQTDVGPRAGMRPVGPQGQGQFGGGVVGSGGGSVGTSQGVTGDYGRQSQTSVGNYYGDTPAGFSDATIDPRRGPIIREAQRTNLLSTGSGGPGGIVGAIGGALGVPVPNLGSIPSGRWDYGFNGQGMMYFNTGKQAFKRGWYLPNVSTSSVDINTVSP